MKIAYLNQRAILKPVFPHRISTREATFFFCLILIISTWFQPKAQEQKKSRFARKYSLVENRLKMATFIRLQGVASSIIGGLYSYNHIFVFTHHKNNRFQKKPIVENTNI